MPEDHRWDPGLQIERTGLAWVRTALSFTVATAVVVRFVAHRSIALAIACAVVSIPLLLAIGWRSWRRYRKGERRLHADAPLPDAVLPAVVAALAAVVGCAGVAYVLLGVA